MTISSPVRIAGPYIGNGTATVFTFAFKVFTASNLQVVRVDTSTGLESTLLLTTDYTVSLNADQDSNPGGNVTLLAVLATGFNMVITSDIANLQPTDLTNQGGFYPEVITDALDRATIQIQQMADELTRSIKIPVTDGLSLDMELPTAAARANSFLAFDATGEPTVVTAGSPGAPTTMTRQQFSGTGAQVAYTLASDPGALGNSCEVFVGGIYQQRDTYTIAGTTLTFTAAPVAGTDNIEVVNFLTTAIGTTDSSLVTYVPAGTGATQRTVQAKLRDVVSVKDFGAVGDGVTDDTAAIQNAINFSASINGCYVKIPSGTYKISSTLLITKSNIKIIGSGGDNVHDGGTGVDGATKIVWNGSAGGTMLEIKTISNILNSKINGTNLIGIEFNGSNSAGIAISIISHSSGKFENLLVQDVTQIAYKISCLLSAALPEAADSQYNFFNQCFYRLVDNIAVQNATGFYLTSQTPTASGANTSFNIFQFCGGQNYSGIGFLLDDADNNSFLQCKVYRIYDNNYAVDLRNSATNGNNFQELSASPAPNTIGVGGTNPYSIKLKGTISGYNGNPFGNSFVNLDNTNGTQPPVLDTGVNAYWSTNNGIEFPKNFVNVATGDTISGASLARTNTSSAYASFMYGGSDVVLGIQSTGGIYSFEVPSAGLRIRRTSGIGTVTELWEDFSILSGNIYPTVDNNRTCGKSGNRWSAVWAANGTIQTSDQREKKDIKDSELGLSFINSLRPVSYKWINGKNEIEKIVFRDKNGNEVDKDSEGALPAEIITKSIPGERTHFGLLSQEVKASLPNGVDFGGWILTDTSNPDSSQGLRYDQFISPLIKAIQELTARIAVLEAAQ